MRPVEFGEALAAGTRLTLFSDDKPDRFFTVIKFWMDETSGVAPHSGLAFLLIKSKTRKAELIYLFIFRSKRMKTASASGGRTTRALIRDRSLRVR
jgi:hypothetical protein